MKSGLSKRIIASWCLYDFANSSYSAVIASVIFPVYYATVIVGNTAGEGDLWWGRAISVSMAFVALTSPILGGLADLKNIRKTLLISYTLLCVISTASLTFLEEKMYLLGFWLICLANIGMEGALVFYNSFLKTIVKSEYHGRVSAMGFGLGYVGSILSLLLALILIKAGHISLVWPMVSVFFLIFSMPLFGFVPDRVNASRKEALNIFQTLGETWKTLRNLLNQTHTRRFLIAYFLYEDAVNTVIVFSSIFAATTLKYRQEELILLYLSVQISAFAGSLVMARPIDYWGPKKVVSLSLVLWVFVCICAYFVESKKVFAIIALTSGLGLGTIQAASRALFAQFIPDNQEAGYFGLYSTVGKSCAIMGPAVFGYLTFVTGSQRPAILFVAMLFLAGLLILTAVRGGGPNIN